MSQTPQIIELHTLDLPELAVFTSLTDTRLRAKTEPEQGILIAESPKVIATALDAGYRPISLLMERRQIEGPAKAILERVGAVPV